MFDIDEDGKRLFYQFIEVLKNKGWKAKEGFGSRFSLIDPNGEHAIANLGINSWYDEKQEEHIDIYAEIVTSKNETYRVELGTWTQATGTVVK